MNLAGRPKGQHRSRLLEASPASTALRRRLTATTVVTLVAWLAGAGPLQAAGDLAGQTPVDLRVQLGDDKGARRFFPERIELETGKLYRLILSNPSPEKHYFSSDAFTLQGHQEAGMVGQIVIK